MVLKSLRGLVMIYFLQATWDSHFISFGVVEAQLQIIYSYLQKKKHPKTLAHVNMWFATVFFTAFLDSLGPSCWLQLLAGNERFWQLLKIKLTPPADSQNLPLMQHNLFSLLQPLSSSPARIVFEPLVIIIKIKFSQSHPRSLATTVCACYSTVGTAEDVFNHEIKKKKKKKYSDTTPLPSNRQENNRMDLKQEQLAF